MAPVVHGLEAEYTDRIVFTYLDIDDPANDKFKQALNYRVQPHYFLLDKYGNVVRQWLGYVPKDDFVRAFGQALQ